MIPRVLSILSIHQGSWGVAFVTLAAGYMQVKQVITCLLSFSDEGSVASCNNCIYFIHSDVEVNTPASDAYHNDEVINTLYTRSMRCLSHIDTYTKACYYSLYNGLVRLLAALDLCIPGNKDLRIPTWWVFSNIRLHLPCTPCSADHRWLG